MQRNTLQLQGCNPQVIKHNREGKEAESLEPLTTKDREAAALTKPPQDSHEASNGPWGATAAKSISLAMLGSGRSTNTRRMLLPDLSPAECTRSIYLPKPTYVPNFLYKSI